MKTILITALVVATAATSAHAFGLTLDHIAKCDRLMAQGWDTFSFVERVFYVIECKTHGWS